MRLLASCEERHNAELIERSLIKHYELSLGSGRRPNDSGQGNLFEMNVFAVEVE